ncbi:MAG: hypothetical protein KTR30_09605 [Saprospiraceae bacterium]|nr:hypothetical protein [Saprospiraceae bacterium]
MSVIYDCIVVGSGPSGVQAAQTLVQGGMQVAMLDVGVNQEQFYQQQFPDTHFSQMRKSDPNQHLYLLGKNMESIHKDWKGNQDRLTPPLAFTKELVKEWQTKSPKQEAFMESLAKGGLGNAWGRGAFTYSNQELKAIGLSTHGWSQHFQEIAQRIGVSGTKGIGVDLEQLMPPLLLDKNMQTIFQRYKRHSKQWKKKGVHMERTPLAVQNQPNVERLSEQYWDIDFWSLQKSAGYHPGHTLKELHTRDNFSYLPQHYVYEFQEIGGSVKVLAKHIQTKENKVFNCRRLILCASVLGTARIVLNSLSQSPRKVPLLCNAFTYGVWLNTRMFGRQNSLKRSSFSQLSMYEREDARQPFNLLNLYTYRSLLLSKLIRELPFSFRFSYQLSAIVKEMLVVGGLHLPEGAHPHNFMQLLPCKKSPLGKSLDIHYQHDPNKAKAALSRMNATMLRLRAIPVLSRPTTPGSSKHYAGTFPFADWPQAFQLAASGRLHFTQNIYIGDASGFRFLPAKGPTLTIMANAHRIAKEVLKSRQIDMGELTKTEKR